MYADKDKQRKAWREWYYRNKKKVRKDNTRRRFERKAWFQSLKRKLKCESCGENHLATLQFHHLERATKEYAVSELIHRGWAIKRILKEISKCVVLCANCHLKLHYEERNK